MTKAPDRFLFMKVGNHAGETWEQILARKKKEFEHTGRTFWGYGGSACHPINQVQPFARLSLSRGEQIVMVMEPIKSDWTQEMVFATEYSADGTHYEAIPKGVNVSGSKYALVLGEIKPGDLEVCLNEYEVAIGPSAGKGAEDYLLGRTDKGCFVRSDAPRETVKGDKCLRKIGFTAELKDPFAVLLR